MDTLIYTSSIDNIFIEDDDYEEVEDDYYGEDNVNYEYHGKVKEMINKLLDINIYVMSDNYIRNIYEEVDELENIDYKLKCVIYDCTFRIEHCYRIIKNIYSKEETIKMAIENMKYFELLKKDFITIQEIWNRNDCKRKFAELKENYEAIEYDC